MDKFTTISSQINFDWRMANFRRPYSGGPECIAHPAVHTLLLYHCRWLKLLGVSLIMHSILGVKLSKKTNFSDVNRHFQAKRAKYWNFHVIETTTLIATKFCTKIRTTKYTLRRGSKWALKRIQNGGRPPYWKNPKNCDILKTAVPLQQQCV